MKKIFFVIIVLSFICGCGYREIERGYLVTALGFSEQDGVIEITAETISSSLVIDKTTERVILSGSGTDASSALYDLKSKLTKPLYFEQLGAVILDADINIKQKNDILNLLLDTDGVHTGVYLAETDDIYALFDTTSPDCILGYDIISLVKNLEQQTDSRVLNQLYNTLQGNNNLPIINAADGSLTIDVWGE